MEAPAGLEDANREPEPTEDIDFSPNQDIECVAVGWDDGKAQERVTCKGNEGDLLPCAPFGFVHRQEKLLSNMIAQDTSELFHLSEAQLKITSSYCNPYILKGYRNGYSMVACLRSIFSIHNETLNIWTHLAGFLYWCTVFFSLETKPWYKASDEMTRAVISVGYFICLIMPLSSAIYHTFCDAQSCCCFKAGHEEEKWSVRNVFLRMDLFGIYTLFYSRSLVEGYLVFYCNRHGWLLYMMLTMFAFIFLAPLGVWKMKLWPMAPSLLLCIFPSLLFLSDASWISSQQQALHLLFTNLGTLCFPMALYFYRRRWPECRWPGHFDIIGQSHQIWHILTWIGPQLILIGVQYRVAYINTLGSCYRNGGKG